jgi:hypothetical protein
MVVLNGTTSSDPDTIYGNDDLTFLSSQKDDRGDCITADLVGGNTANPIFTALSTKNDLQRQ